MRQISLQRSQSCSQSTNIISPVLCSAELLLVDSAEWEDRKETSLYLNSVYRTRTAAKPRSFALKLATTRVLYPTKPWTLCRHRHVVARKEGQ